MRKTYLYKAKINRLFLHPLGMALEVNINEDGSESLGGIWDYRDDPEGIIFNGFDADKKEKIQKVKDFTNKKHQERFKQLGYIIQE